ncbi:hypothetical protein BGX27_001181 [Mortierella sp. AM989]|nr:hypothetical protein BGX27_001181 [Mortierella sp. AM989]
MDDSFAFNIWEAISTCSKLDKIRFHKCHLLRAKEKLVDAIKHARILRVTYTYYDFKGIKPPLTTTSPPRLPNLQSLDILRSREYSCSGDISPIIQHAPNLVSLKMDPQLAPDPASYMHELSVSISGCPKLQDIKLDHMTLLKEETTMVLDAITDAKRLDWGVGEISEQAFRSIMSRHARTITHLHLSESPGLTSSMAQTIMISCSLLESLKLSTISGTNLVRINTVDQGNQSSSKNTGRLILGEDWICLRLRALKLQLDLSSITMNIDRDTPEGESLFQRQQQLEQYHAFRQIGRLTLLQDLNISESQYDTRNKRSLDLRLGENGGGLEGLAALKKLNTIKFRNTKQELSEKEIGWMISNWLHLYRIGDLSSSIIH